MELSLRGAGLIKHFVLNQVIPSGGGLLRWVWENDVKTAIHSGVRRAEAVLAGRLAEAARQRGTEEHNWEAATNVE